MMSSDNNDLISRRKMLAGLGALGGLSLTGCKSETYVPPNIAGLYHLSDTLSMSVQRFIMQRQPLVREFDTGDISKNFPAIGTTMPEDENYLKALGNGFADWRLPVTGLVENPLSLSVADIQGLPARTQITSHSCERGWTAIAQWSGTPLFNILKAAKMKPEARYVVFDCTDGWYESIDLFDALHPQTLLAYGMNGGDLPVQHGGPIRLRVNHDRRLAWRKLCS